MPLTLTNGGYLEIQGAVIPGGTRVTGSSYMFDQQIARFLSTLPSYEAPSPVLALEAPSEDATPGATAA